MNRAHTAMESLSAHDELGLALLRFESDARQALTEFNLAIELAPQGVNPSDGEWAALYWHRASAEQKLGTAPPLTVTSQLRNKLLPVQPSRP